MAKREDEDDNGHLLDLQSLIDRVVGRGLDPAVFDVDLDVKFAKNVIDFALSPDFMKMDSLWAKQAEQAVRLYREYCPRCSDKEFLANVPVDAAMGTFRSKIVLLNHGICPECHANKCELFDKLPWELVSCLGQRAGKTALTGGVLAPYYLHKFLEFPNPARFYGLMANSSFQMTFVAVTATQIKQTLWSAFSTALSQSPWYMDYIAKLKRKEKENSFDKGTLVKVLDSYVWFGNKHISASYAAADMKSLRGATRVFCVAGDTLVATNEGLLRADEISNRLSLGLKFLTHDKGLLAPSQEFTRKVPTLTLTTEHGFEVTGSHDHPVLILRTDGTSEYVPLKNLSEGDQVVLSTLSSFPEVPSDLPSVTNFGNYQKYFTPKKMTPDLAYLAGILISEGYLRKEGPRWHTSDLEILNKSVSTFESVFGKKPKVIEHAAQKDGWKPGWYIDVQSNIVARFLASIGVEGKSANKEVPWSILKSNKECVTQFLAGYFDGDGHVDPYHICAHSKSPLLLKQIQVLLLSLGVVSYRTSYERMIKGKKTLQRYSKLNIYGSNIEKFQRQIDLISRKVTDGSFTDTESVRIDGGFLKTDKVSLNHDVWYRRKSTTHFGVSLVRKVTEHLKDQNEAAARLHPLLNGDYVFSEVKSIVESSEQTVYDWTVPDSHSFLGNGIVLHNCSVDELGWFNTNKDTVRANADETYAALSNSLRTVRSSSDRLWAQGEHRTLPGIMTNISSPSSQYDKMMSLLKEGLTDSRKECFHMSSWEASPLITRESLETEESNNPIKFWRDFGAVPPIADSPFIESALAIAEMRTTNNPLVNWRPKFIKDKVDPNRSRYISAELIGGIANSNDRLVPRCIAVDCGETANSFCIGVFHLEPGVNDEGSKFVMVVDAIIEAKPEKIAETGEIIPVHFPSMFNIVKTLCDKHKWLNIRAVLYDRWQSTGQIQELRDMKVRAEKYSPKEQDFKALRSLVYAGNIKMPKWEHPELIDLDITNVAEIRKAPYVHMAVQFATVREVGKKIIKPEAGDDDLFRTCVLGSYFMAEHQKDFLTKVIGSGTDSRTHVGSVGLKSSTLGSYRGSRASTSIGSVRGKYNFQHRR